ncbi:hypothetical protein GCM10010971_11740 [Silvimonas amylolytica]|uniref:Uncharacterized protein n=1 Tax=Silvimonas amylolytica TaxID=449663 RepID=A0ABQ2PIE8_9NEIS|nr:hypothetical protein GCM10010971_11740 [Silvimonas amylolytica]
MRIEVHGDFTDHGIGQAVVADHHDRIKMMGKATQVAALIRSKFHIFDFNTLNKQAIVPDGTL